jgi:hypothetical protein
MWELSRNPERRAARWRLLALVQAAILGLLAALGAYRWTMENMLDLGWAEVDSHAPGAAQISAIIRPLRYSGIAALGHPDVRLGIDVRNRQWVMHNIRSFDGEGNIVLDAGRYGVCGELAAFVLPKVKKVLGLKYAVQVIKASDSNYFPEGNGVHFVVLITDLEQPKRTYILDPSFRRYGPAYRFKNYSFFAEVQSFMRTNNRDMRNGAGAGVPLIIQKGHVLILGLDPIDGRFDLDNHAVMLTLLRKNEYEGERVLAFVREAGVVREYEDEVRLRDFLGADLYRTLRSRLRDLFMRLPADSRRRVP